MTRSTRLLRSRNALGDSVAARYLLRTIHSFAQKLVGSVGDVTPIPPHYGALFLELRGETLVSLDIEPAVRELTHQIVSGFPALQRQVLMRHVNDQMTYRQIAAELHMKPRDCLRLLSQTYAILSCELRQLEKGAASASQLARDHSEPQTPE